MPRSARLLMPVALCGFLTGCGNEPGGLNGAQASAPARSSPTAGAGGPVFSDQRPGRAEPSAAAPGAARGRWRLEWSDAGFKPTDGAIEIERAEQIEEILGRIAAAHGTDAFVILEGPSERFIQARLADGAFETIEHHDPAADRRARLAQESVPLEQAASHFRAFYDGFNGFADLPGWVRLGPDFEPIEG